MYQGVRIFFHLRSFGGVSGWVNFHPNIVRLEKTVRKNGRPLIWVQYQDINPSIIVRLHNQGPSIT